MGKTKKKRHIIPSAIIILAIGLTAFIYWYFSLTVPNLPKPPLKELAAAHRIDLGIHVSSSRLDDRVYPSLISSQFNFVTIDGEIHFKELQPTPAKYDFAAADKIVSFAKDHNMPIQLHHLVWGDVSRLPKWLTTGNYTNAQLLNILHNHITSIVKHYKGQVSEYTVLNEAFTEDQHVYGLKNWWADHLGNDAQYMDDYFIWAHQADPKAKLILNDFHNEVKDSVSDAMYNYVKAAKARGVPIDGIGMQMHIDASYPRQKQDVIDNMKRFGAIGIPVYVTEFDVNTNSVKGSNIYKSQLESKITNDMVRACIESKVCVSFTAFDLTSKNNLVKKITGTNSRDYILDSRYRPRPSFYAFRQAWQQP